jgi:radical SAM protein with 4Fe4S-binding SPASM domain
LDGKHTPTSNAKELTTEEAEGIIDEVVDAGCLWLLLTGGELLLRPDWRDIYLHAKRRGLIVTLFTNGTLVSDGDADFLAEWKPLQVSISLYGASSPVYESITQRAGSYHRCIQGVERLVERGVPVSLKTVLMRPNVSELQEMRNLADSLGVSFSYDPFVRPAASGATFPLAYRLPPDEIIRIQTEDPDRQAEWLTKYNQRSAAEYDPGELYMCNAGRTSFSIDPYGRLTLCITSRYPAYDLRGGSFIEGWQNTIAAERALRCSATYGCRDCYLRRMCPQCPALAHLAGGDREAIDGEICEVSHQVAARFLSLSGCATAQLVPGNHQSVLTRSS